jgi:hypothetical protein
MLISLVARTHSAIFQNDWQDRGAGNKGSRPKGQHVAAVGSRALHPGHGAV